MRFTEGEIVLAHVVWSRKVVNDAIGTADASVTDCWQDPSDRRQRCPNYAKRESIFRELCICLIRTLQTLKLCSHWCLQLFLGQNEQLDSLSRQVILARLSIINHFSRFLNLCTYL